MCTSPKTDLQKFHMVPCICACCTTHHACVCLDYQPRERCECRDCVEAMQSMISKAGVVHG